MCFSLGGGGGGGFKTSGEGIIIGEGNVLVSRGCESLAKAMERSFCYETTRTSSEHRSRSVTLNPKPSFSEVPMISALNQTEGIPMNQDILPLSILLQRFKVQGPPDPEASIFLSTRS